MARQRVHNEYFRTVSLGGRKSCPACRAKLASSERIWSWGEYSAGRWYTVQHFCRGCFDSVRARLIAHAEPCGCTFQLVGYCVEKLPAWLTLEGTNTCV